jgi:RecB family exonuclease
VITPRRTRLLRSPDLAGFRARLVEFARGLDPLRAADTLILVPTRAAGEQLRRTIEDRLLAAPGSACVLPLIGTRTDLYDTLATRLRDLPRVLTGFEREVMLGAAARDAEDAGLPPPFHLRPALLAEMLALYDQVRRQARTIDDFERLVTTELAAAADLDRGASQLLEQTRFVVATFRGYEARLADGELKDEHLVREAVLAAAAARPLRHIVITVGDRLSDPEGLWPADAAMLTAVSGLEAIDVLATDGVLNAGYLDRLQLAFVGIEEVAGGPPAPPPILVMANSTAVFEYRDREDELEDVARRLKASRRAARQMLARRSATREGGLLDRHALIVARPLPYLYLARDVFGGAGVPFEALDTLPLAAEPYSAALDLVIEFVATEFTRGALTGLLRSPHFRFTAGDYEVTPSAVLQADIALVEGRYLGGFDRLTRLAGADDALPAVRAAHAAASVLAPLADNHPLVEHIERLVAFLQAYDRPPADEVPERDRRRRVQAAVIGALTGLADAYRRHDPAASGTVADLGPAVRRWLGAQTFATRTGEAGLQIVDVQAARFGDFDDVQLMGLVDGEWPERPSRNIFYPQSLLAQLEPARPEQVDLHREREMLRAGRAAFRDLLGLANVRTRVSTFSLESDAVVEPSVLIDDLGPFAAGTQLPSGSTSRLETPLVGTPSDRDVRVFTWEALAQLPQVPDVLSPPAADWARLRIAATRREDSRFHGEAGPWHMPRVSVSRLETYLKCPFQFYAKNVLLLDEEPEDELTRSPLERGRFLHELFETFFHEWQLRGHGRITPDTIDEARALFTDVCEPALVSLGPAEAGLERALLFGSAVAPGIADRVFAMEAERPVDIRRRFMEYELDGAFSFSAEDGATRTVRLRAKIDRVDLLADGSFRLIDYKTSYVMDRKLALQLPIYSACVRDRLSKEEGRPVPVSEAMYLSFEGQKSVVRLEAKGKTTDELITEAEYRLTGALDDIAAGHYPPRPHQKSLCKMCAYVAVCRTPGGINDASEGDVQPGTGSREPGTEGAESDDE